MKTKAKSILALAVLMICMSSCVYSLFPIYTKDTLVYLPELLGKWQVGNSPDDYILIEKAVEVEASFKVTEGKEPTDPAATNKVTVTNKSFEITYDGDEYIVQNGDTIRDKEKVKAYYEQVVDSAFQEFAKELSGTLQNLGRAVKSAANKPGGFSYSSDDQAYIMTIKDGDYLLKYEMHLAKIGEDIFMDLYPTDDKYTDQVFGSMVWFPVHTFMKMELDGNKLEITQFDLDKMNKLFDSNLIRMSHEKVDGSVLITAKSEEIQKFLEKYSRDESVFDGQEVYHRVTAE